MSNTPRILDLDIELPLLSNSIIVDEKIAEHNADEEAHPYILGVLEEKANSADLATVATTGDYNDLQNIPSDLATDSDVTNAISTHNESDTAHTDIRNEISGIQELIPTQAASDNQLADKNFVNSSIATSTATFRGTYNVVSDLHLHYNSTHSEIEYELDNLVGDYQIEADNNDYVFVQIPTADATPTEIASIERYKFAVDHFVYEYTLNNSGFTSAQWAAINSGITSGLVTQIGTNASDIISLQTSVSGKVSKSGDTMTGDLTMDGSAVIVKGTSYWFKLIQDTSTITISSSNNNGQTWSPQLQMWNSQNQARFKGSVYVDGGTINDDNKLLKRSDGDIRWIQINPENTNAQQTLVAGIPNIYPTVDFTVLQLPADPGNAEYFGRFTSSTAGDISVSLPLTYWTGDVNIAVGHTYEFSIQNGSGHIIMLA